MSTFHWWNASCFLSECYLCYSAASHQLYWVCLSRSHLWWLASHSVFLYGCVMVIVSGFLEGSMITVKMFVKLQGRKRFVFHMFLHLAIWVPFVYSHSEPASCYVPDASNTISKSWLDTWMCVLSAAGIMFCSLSEYKQFCVPVL